MLSKEKVVQAILDLDPRLRLVGDDIGIGLGSTPYPMSVLCSVVDGMVTVVGSPPFDLNAVSLSDVVEAARSHLDSLLMMQEPV